jgi:hypothetical protein
MHLYSTFWYITSAPTAYAVLGAQLGMVCENDVTDVRHKTNATPRMTAESFFIGGAPKSFFQLKLLDRMHLPWCIPAKRRAGAGRSCFLDEVGVLRGARQKARAKNSNTVHVLMKRFNKI